MIETIQWTDAGVVKRLGQFHSVRNPGVTFLIPYLQLQLTGLGIIVEVASFDAVGRTPAMVVAVSLAEDVRQAA